MINLSKNKSILGILFIMMLTGCSPTTFPDCDAQIKDARVANAVWRAGIKGCVNLDPTDDPDLKGQLDQCFHDSQHAVLADFASNHDITYDLASKCVLGDPRAQTEHD